MFNFWHLTGAAEAAAAELAGSEQLAAAVVVAEPVVDVAERQQPLAAEFVDAAVMPSMPDAVVDAAAVPGCK